MVHRLDHMHRVPFVAPLIVRGDLAQAWKPLPRALLLGAGVGAVLGGFMLADGLGWYALGVPVFGAVAAGLPLGIGHSLWWALLPARVSYTVADGFLTCRRGKRVVWQRSCTEIVSIGLGPPLDWPTLLLTGWLGWVDFVPSAEVEVETGDRWSPDNRVHSLPAILLWGDETQLAEVERHLNAAIALCQREEGTEARRP